jgi:hypothetical protein
MHIVASTHALRSSWYRRVGACAKEHFPFSGHPQQIKLFLVRLKTSPRACHLGRRCDQMICARAVRFLCKVFLARRCALKFIHFLHRRIVHGPVADARPVVCIRVEFA